MSKTLTVAKKELWTYFCSPTAYIFLGTYLLVSLFTFFWVDKFFSRNLADLRPLFDWMPILMIFLVSTLTMKMWSEEHRMGTLEFLLTLPLKTHELVLGKFLACMGLITVALGLTLGLAFTVGRMGPVDWGPVFAAYLASWMLASAYVSIGLFISSRTESQIVSLIVTTLICSAFYMIGSPALVGLFGNESGEVLRLVGSGSRFNSVSRGVLDLRDVYYYLSITLAFLTLNGYSLERLKWSQEGSRKSHALLNTLTLLVVANLFAGDFWLQKVYSARIDMTSDRAYSISESTQQVFEELKEPLLIRGYFSAKTHPLLAPLVPTVRDFLREYQLASHGRVRAEFVDPAQNENIEAEANSKYNIKPVPFQVADKHSAAMVSSYFNIVVQYGNDFQVLGFEDLIEVKQNGMGEIDVSLRNLEHDLTAKVKKVMQEFNNSGNLFAAIKDPVKFVGYISSETLPSKLSPLYKDIQESLKKFEADSNGKLTVEFQDPSKDSAVAEKIATEYGFKPQMLSLFSDKTFYFYLTLQQGDSVYALGIPEDLTVKGFNTSMESSIKRLAPGFLKMVGIMTPEAPQMNPMMAQFGGQQGGKQFQAVEQKLGQDYSTKKVDLDNGVVPSDVDVLLVLAPKDLSEKQVFAVDQFLMAGGTVIIATSPIGVEISRNGFQLEQQKSGLESWLASHGIEIPKELVLDTQNSGFPQVRRRTVGGITINEPTIAPYPFFIDARPGHGLNADNGISAGLAQLTLAWPSPIVVDAKKNEGRKTVELVKSSADSWRTDELNIESDMHQYPKIGFKEGEKKEPSVLAVMVEGSFPSYFAGRESPLLAKTEEPKDDDHKHGKGHDHGKKPSKDEEKAIVTGVIEKSTSGARIILFASNEFLADEVLRINGMINGSQYLNPVQLVENALDWATEDRALLAIRSRGHFTRLLLPMTDEKKSFWEYFNYVLAMLGLAGVYGGFRVVRARAKREYESMNLA